MISTELPAPYGSSLRGLTHLSARFGAMSTPRRVLSHSVHCSRSAFEPGLRSALRSFASRKCFDHDFALLVIDLSHVINQKYYIAPGPHELYRRGVRDWSWPGASRCQRIVSRPDRDRTVCRSSTKLTCPQTQRGMSVGSASGDSHASDLG
jgi:hypothetical protein